MQAAHYECRRYKRHNNELKNILNITTDNDRECWRRYCRYDIALIVNKLPSSSK